jgi:hypothetical protein
MNVTALDHAEEIARGLARRIAEIQKSEEQLAAFTWEGRDDVEDLSGEATGDSQLLLLRALHVASESGMYELLSRLAHEGDVRLPALVKAMDLPRMAVIDRISALSQAGLASRELESNRVGATQLGRGIVSMLDTVTDLVDHGVDK